MSVPGNFLLPRLLFYGCKEIEPEHTAGEKGLLIRHHCIHYTSFSPVSISLWSLDPAFLTLSFIRVPQTILFWRIGKLTRSRWHPIDVREYLEIVRGRAGFPHALSHLAKLFHLFHAFHAFQSCSTLGLWMRISHDLIPHGAERSGSKHGEEGDETKIFHRANIYSS